MNEEYPQLLEAVDDTLVMGVFVIGIVTPPKQAGEEVSPENVREIYSGDCSSACALFVWGLIRKNTSEGKQSIILHNRATDIKFPNEYE